ncbi:hypothetical protein ACFLRF_03450 [Candidatus Altiarchaeota archaeon]
MFKSVKISEDAYLEAKKLAGEMNKDIKLAGGRNMGISNVLAEAIHLARDNYHRKKRVMKLAGAWKDVDSNELIKDVYDDRSRGSRPEVGL